MALLKPTTFEEQINIIKKRIYEKSNFNEKNMTHYLKIVGYERLIYPYEKILYKDAGNKGKKFKENIGSQEIINIYEMDREISKTVLSYILNFENELKSQIKIHIAEEIRNQKSDVGKNLKVKEWKKLKKDAKAKKNNKNIIEEVKIANTFLKFMNVNTNIIQYSSQVTYFDIVNSLTFTDLIKFINLNYKNNEKNKEKIKKFLAPYVKANIKFDKLISTLNYIIFLRNKLAHNHSIILKGDSKNHVQRKKLYFHNNNLKDQESKTTKKNYYQIKDILLFFKMYSEKYYLQMVSEIIISYTKFSYTNGELIFHENDLFGEAFAKKINQS